MNNVVQLFERTVESYPDKMAFLDEDISITYKELQKRSRSIAGFLLGKAIKPNSPVVFYMKKSVLAVCGIFGCLYARLPYCFVDIEQPDIRLHKVISLLDPPVIFTDCKNCEKARKKFSDRNTDIVQLEDIEFSVIDETVLEKVLRTYLDTDPIYINFTSGSTGTPKGVVVSHRNVIDFISNFVEIFGISSEDVLANQAPFDFDVSVKDIYSAAVTGASVVLIPREYFSVPIKLMDFLVDHQVTTLIWAVSAICFVSIMKGFHYKIPVSIKKVLFSGETMPVKQLNIWREYLPDTVYVNLYGPTEITCNCTYHIVDRAYDTNDRIPIGTAFPNEKVFLLDEEDRLVTRAGDIGEICVSGSCVAIGYYRNEEKTREVFIQNPLNHSYYERIYRTGDLAEYDDQGNLIYISRKDFQIKHLGHRIELGEIEKTAEDIDGVDRACAIYYFEKSRIHLFYSGEIEKSDLQSKLKEQLPMYMLPSKITSLENLPLNKNGKIDRVWLKETGGFQ